MLNAVIPLTSIILPLLGSQNDGSQAFILKAKTWRVFSEESDHPKKEDLKLLSRRFLNQTAQPGHSIVELTVDKPHSYAHSLQSAFLFLTSKYKHTNKNVQMSNERL